MTLTHTVECVFLCCVQHLRQELELKFYEDRFDWDEVRQNDAAGLLKMFIRELPYPLLTQQHLPAFTAAQSQFNTAVHIHSSVTINNSSSF